MNHVIRRGDVFAVEPAGRLGMAILAVERVIGSDRSATVSHAGIIMDQHGSTLEVLSTTKISTIGRYIGKRVAIFRPIFKIAPGEEAITDFERHYCTELAKHQHLGQEYPWWRLPLTAVKAMAKYIPGASNVICSELVARYLFCLGARHDVWQGVTPDDLLSEWQQWRGFIQVHDGILTANVLEDKTL
jgi:hypothetical protein